MAFLSVTPLTLILGIAVMACALVAFVVHLRSARSRKKQALKSLPGPINYPVVGMAPYIGMYSKPCDGLSALSKQYGDIYGINLGSRRCVVVSNMALIKEILVTKSQDFANRPDFLRFHTIFRGNRHLSIALCDWSGKQKTRRDLTYAFMHLRVSSLDAIALCDWSEKQKTRRDLTYAFMHPRVSSLDGTRMNHFIMQELQELTTALNKVENQPINPRPYILFTCANIFYQYICSQRFPENDANFRKIVEIYDVVFRELFTGFAVDIMPWTKIFNLKKLRELQHLAETVSSVTEPIFEDHEKDIDHDKPRDLVDVFLSYLKDNEGKSEFSLTREDAEVIVEDLIGGHSVLGNLWQWGLYLLSVNPEVQANIREEIARVTGNCRAPSLEDRCNMPYTEATALELLRVITSPIIPHVATRDTSVQGFKVEKDTMVLFNTLDINMNPELWSEPRKFNPERFLSSSGTVSKPDYFIPFGTGKRTCLGDGLVKATLFLGISTLLQNFDISLPQGVPLPDMCDIPGLVVPRHDIQLTFSQVRGCASTTIDMA